MATLDTDYASEPQTCASDSESSSGAEDISEMAERRKKAGLGVSAKMAIGLVWRNPNVSKSYKIDV